MTAYSQAAHRWLVAQAARVLVAGGEHLHCRADGSHDCSGYHRGWMLLQDLGLISGLASERGFIVGAIRGLAARQPVRTVQIAGCADFGLLSVLHEALGDTVGTVAITVRDRCETPLALCRWYAAQMGFEVHCQRQDLLHDVPPGVFDLVLTHSLLSFCPAHERGELMARLARQLTQGGTLLVYQSIRPSAQPVALEYGEAEVAAMVERALHEGRAVMSAAQWADTAVADIVRAFCHDKKTLSVPSAGSVVAAAEAHGLVLRGSRLLFDSASSSHRAATPESRHFKYEFSLGAGS